MDDLCVVYVTASNKEEAANIGRELVSRRLAACVNIYEGITSIYRWEGKKEENPENALFIKTKKSLLSEVKNTVKELHSYSCPCIVAFPVIDPDRDYANWVISQTK